MIDKTPPVATQSTTTDAPPPLSKTVAFRFGDPEPVLDGHSLFEYGYCPMYSNWYDLPYDIRAVSKLFRATSHHTSALTTKRNILTTAFKPHPLLSRQEFSALVLNLLTFANGYLHIERSRLGSILRIRARPAVHMRRMRDLDQYVQLHSGVDIAQGTEHQFAKGEIIHIYEPDLDQEIYGIPHYLSSINSILLNEAATLFRRKYYKNGAHAGFILHISDAMNTQEDIDDVEQALRNSKGAGNFNNMLIYTPNGQKDGVKVIPLAEVAAKDEFMNIKIASRDDQLAAHCMPPQLIGVVPSNAGGFGDIEKAARVFFAHEIRYRMNMLLDINERLGIEVIRFDEYELLKAIDTAPPNP